MDPDHSDDFEGLLRALPRDVRAELEADVDSALDVELSDDPFGNAE